MCEQCIVIPYYYGEAFPDVQLIRSRRETKTSDMELYDWGLVIVNDPFVTFKTKPIMPTEDNQDQVMECFDNFCNEFIANIGYDQTFTLYEKYREDFLNQRKIWQESEDDATGTIFDNMPLQMYAERNMAYVYLKIAKLIEESKPEADADDQFEHINSLEGVKVDLDYDPKKV